MTIHEARLIREVKKGCTYRRLAEIYYPKRHPGYGNQGYGEDLCKEALQTLYPKFDYWQRTPTPDKPAFRKANKSYLGEFYWWE